MMNQPPAPLFRFLPLFLILGLLFSACAEKGDKGDKGDPGENPVPPIGINDPLPGLDVQVVALDGATGTGGNFQVGDIIRLTFTAKRADNGEPIPLEDLTRGQAMVSGPTFNYQRVIAAQSDVLTTLVANADGSFTYTFPVGIPATYIAPLNNTPNFQDDVLTGQALLGGTYTVGLELATSWKVGETSYSDPANVVVNFLYGPATSVDKRELVTQANCTSCHETLAFHGGNRTRVENCLLCHTAGSEDKNDPAVEGGTPDVSVEFKVMIHKIHSGANLGSVLGVTTKTDGTRDYGATPKPYRIVGFRNSVHDFSDIQLPMWPSLANPMPRDAGYNLLPSAAKAQEDAMRRGPVSCDSCHGDPDGAGPLPPPEDGALIYSQLTRRSCGACHDDWVWDRAYLSNAALMPAQTNDSTCILCHKVSGDPLAVMDAHNHPLVDDTKATGVRFEITSLVEAGINNGNGKLDPGETPQVSFTVKDAAGANIPLSSLSRFEMVMSGPTENPNLVHYSSMPNSTLGTGPTYTTMLPEKVHLEIVGSSTAAPNESFTTARIPHWDQTGFETQVFVRTGAGGSPVLTSSASVPGQNYVDLAVGGGASFGRDTYVVIEDLVGSKAEYLRVQFVDGDRLWFSAINASAYPRGLRNSHAVGADVRSVTMTLKTVATDYTLNATTGTITEVTEFGTNAEVVVTSTTNFVMPTQYRGTLNESPDLDSSWGDWLNLPIVSGTYTLGLHAVKSFGVTVIATTTTYNDASPPAVHSFLVGSATELTTNQRISSADNCYRCHGDITFHGTGRRGYDTCLLCHGIAGAEDRPRYVAAGAPETSMTTIDFRTMLHKIHHGKELDKAASYQVVGFGGAPHPNNFSVHTYEKVGFPVMPSGTKNCKVCHGADNDAWKRPADRKHPLGQPLPTRTYRAACITCHDADADRAHMDVNTSSSGFESCDICHGPGKAQEVERSHLIR
jgi:Outer membrane cytochrome MtrC/MtrF-like, domains II/IV